jgi:hypothetical protein
VTTTIRLGLATHRGLHTIKARLSFFCRVGMMSMSLMLQRSKGPDFFHEPIPPT